MNYLFLKNSNPNSPASPRYSTQGFCVRKYTKSRSNTNDPASPISPKYGRGLFTLSPRSSQRCKKRALVDQHRTNHELELVCSYCGYSFTVKNVLLFGQAVVP